MVIKEIFINFTHPKSLKVHNMETMFKEALNASKSSIPERNATRFRERLKDLIPIVTDLVRKSEHKIGVSEYDCDEYKDNSFIYDKDGWYIEIEYRCCGKWYNDLGDYWNPPCTDLICAWGDVTNLEATYYDEIADNEVDFSADDLCELRSRVNEVLKNIA